MVEKILVCPYLMLAISVKKPLKLYLYALAFGIVATLIDCRILIILSSNLFRCLSVIIVGRVTFPGINWTVLAIISLPLLDK